MPDWSRRKFRSYLRLDIVMLEKERVAYHAAHKFDEPPKGNGIVLHDSVNGGEQITHALDITKLFVVFVVSQKHVLHLFEVNISPGLCKRRIRIWMRDIFAFKEGNMSIGSMYVFFYMTNPIEWA
jgi:hypothetical protein